MAPRAAFGQTPSQLWIRAVAALPGLLERVETSWDRARAIAGEVRESRLASAAVGRYAPVDGYDLGAQGAVRLLDEATTLIEDATNDLRVGGADHRHAETRVSRSYLSAVGVLTNAAQRLETETATYQAEDDLRQLTTLLVEDRSLVRA